MIRYGYHGLGALICLIAEEVEQEKQNQLFRDYVGQTLWDIDDSIRRLGNSKNEMPQYVELMHPEIKKPEMTANEIKDYILGKLTA